MLGEAKATPFFMIDLFLSRLPRCTRRIRRVPAQAAGFRRSPGKRIPLALIRRVCLRAGASSAAGFGRSPGHARVRPPTAPVRQAKD